MKSLCVFVNYKRPQESLAFPINFVNELVENFDDVIVATNQATALQFANRKWTEIVYKNEGYDFGMWYKTLQNINRNEYNRIALINDSNEIIKSLDIPTTIKYDMWGLTDSFEAPRDVNPNNSYHVQSHFMIFEKKAIPYLYSFFKDINFEQYFKIKNQNKLRQEIINNCEIGISQYMLKNGMKLGATYSAKTFIPQNSNRDFRKTNMHVWLWKELIEKGYPLIKTKILRKEWTFLKNLNECSEIIKKYSKINQSLI
jgi:hypothetical protein